MAHQKFEFTENLFRTHLASCDIKRGFVSRYTLKPSHSIFWNHDDVFDESLLYIFTYYDRNKLLKYFNVELSDTMGYFYRKGTNIVLVFFDRCYNYDSLPKKEMCLANLPPAEIISLLLL